MYCINCGQQLETTDQFCGYCGTKVLGRSKNPPVVPPTAPTPQQNQMQPTPMPLPTQQQQSHMAPPQQQSYAPPPPQYAQYPQNKGPSPFAVVMMIFGISFLGGVGYYAFQNADEDHKDDGPKQTSSKYKDVDDPDDFPYHKEKESCSESIVNQARGAIFEIDQNIRSGPSRISIEDEEELGDKVLENATEQMKGRLVTDSKDAKYIARIGNALAKKAERKEVNYRFYLMEDTDVENAFATPGGHVVITRPMLNKWVENEAQLATIIGHEIIHIDKRHTTAVYDYVRKDQEEEEERQKGKKKKSKDDEGRKKGNEKKSKDDEVSNEDVAIVMAQILTTVAYSPKREAESDEYGAEMIYNEGYSTFQSVRLWEQQEDRQGGGSSSKDKKKEEDDSLFGDIIKSGVQVVSDVFASHPDPGYRACNLKRKTYELYQEKPLDHPYRGTKNWNNKKAKMDKMY
jgi:Zn-dependent protease with chaperone function